MLSQTTNLLVISPSPATVVDGNLFLDKKFVEGMRFYNEAWPGRVSCLLPAGDSTFPFGRIYGPGELPFGVTLLPANHVIGLDDLSGYDLLLISGDNHEYLHLAELCAASDRKSVFTVEYIAQTRREIIWLEREYSLPKKIYSTFWMLNQERRRRHAFAIADGIQANGYPAINAYKPLNANPIMYLDNRISERMLASPEEMEARQDRLLAGTNLRLIHSGRLEPMKGSQDLIPIARQLVQDGIDFELNVFGSGSLEPEIRDVIQKYDLQNRVILNGVVDFETELVPFARTKADIYLSCHRQSDPSCTYLESMGCGLAVAGYANRMWSALCQESGAGWAVPLGKVGLLAKAIGEAARDRAALASHCRAAWSFAGNHTFENEFEMRINHLKTIVASK